MNTRMVLTISAVTVAALGTGTAGGAFAAASPRKEVPTLIDGEARIFDSTIILWHGEFGRMPISERMDGRDHNAHGFSVWLAGGGIKGGTVVGATDDFGYRAVENKKSIYELHATILHLLGLDYDRLTYRFNGRNMRLTDVHGEVVRGVLA